MNRESPRNLFQRFPALHRLGQLGRARRVPWVQQLEAADCGAACLAMVLALHGKHLALREVRALTRAGRGVDAATLLEAGRALGLRGQAVRVELAGLRHLRPGSILHWEFNHFVVLDRLHKDAVEIVDPSQGRRRVSLQAFRASFTGIALLFEPSENFRPQRREGGRAWRYARQVLLHRDILARVVTLSLAVQVFGLALPMFTGSIVDRVVPTGDRDLLPVLMAGFLSVVAFQFVSLLLRSNLLLNLRTLVDARMTLGFVDHLLELPYAFFQRHHAGDLMMRLSSNATVREIVTSGALSSAIDGVLVAVYLTMIFAVDVPMGALVLGLSAVQIVGPLALVRRRRQLMSESLEIQARSRNGQMEALNGIETLKMLGAERQAGELLSAGIVDELNASLARGRLDALAEAVSGTIHLGAPLAILALGAHQVLGGALPLGDMLAVSALASGFLAPLAAFVMNVAQIQLLDSYLDRIDEVLDTAPEQAERRAPAPRLRGKIALERVSFAYEPGGPLVLREATVELQSGQFVAIVGRSGAGKSTLASLLLGLFRPSSGRILFDDLDIANMDLVSLRRQIGVVPQRPYLFGRSIRSNVLLDHPSGTLDDAAAAARLAHIHDEVMAMPMGYETVLVEGGSALSGGQRQRLALARALARKPAVLLLDEATSALDAVTEAKIHAELAAMRCTRIVIAHRLSTVRAADLVLVMENGQLVEQGRHEELLSRSGVYASLVAAQLEGESPALSR